MSSKKLSALTEATTPLAGSELMYVVQGGNSRRATVSNVLAGAGDVSGPDGGVTDGHMAVWDGATGKLVKTGGAPFQDSRQVATQHSLAGGGDLSEDRTLSLVNDEASPGNNKVYGTDGAGARGWKDDPSGSADTVTAASTFATDNRLLRSDGTGRGAQASGVTLDDNDRMTGHGNMAWQAATESGGDVTFDTANGSLLNWHVTLTATAEVQIPANLPDGWTCYIEIDPDGQTITWAAAYRSPVPDFTEKALIAIVRRGSEYIATLAHEEAAA